MKKQRKPKKKSPYKELNSQLLELMNQFDKKRSMKDLRAETGVSIKIENPDSKRKPSGKVPTYQLGEQYHSNRWLAAIIWIAVLGTMGYLAKSGYEKHVAIEQLTEEAVTELAQTPAEDLDAVIQGATAEQIEALAAKKRRAIETKIKIPEPKIETPDYFSQPPESMAEVVPNPQYVPRRPVQPHQQTVRRTRRVPNRSTASQGQPAQSHPAQVRSSRARTRRNPAATQRRPAPQSARQRKQVQRAHPARQPASPKRYRKAPPRRSRVQQQPQSRR